MPDASPAETVPPAATVPPEAAGTSAADAQPADTPATPAPPAEAPAPRLAWLRTRWQAPAALIVLAVALFAAYLYEARTVGTSSESAGQALQAWDMLHGNLLLRGWHLSDVSFYTTELPEYMLIELVRGLNAGTAHLAAALTYTLMVVLGALVAKGRATGRAGLVRMLIAGGIMLAPPHDIVYILLSAPDHTGTQVPLLLGWLILDRARPRWWVPVLVTIVLAWVQVADTLALYAGAVPLAVVCAVRMYRRRGPLREQWYDLSLAVGALVSAAAARLAIDVIRHFGGFIVKTPIAQFATPHDLSNQFWPAIGNVLAVFGADFLGRPFGPEAISPLLHLVGAGLAVWAVAIGVRHFFAHTCDDRDLVTPVLTLAFVIQLVAYIFGTKQDPNEIVGLLPVGAVLAGRLLAGRLTRARLQPVLGLVAAGLAGLLVLTATRPPAPPSPRPDLAAVLRAHDLRYGLAGFWSASSVTAQTGDQIQVRPARMYHLGVVTTLSESDATWYDASQHDANFAIAERHRRCGGPCLTVSGLTKTFGPPAVAYPAGQYLVLVWNKNLLPQLRTLYWCHGWPWKTQNPAVTAPCQ